MPKISPPSPFRISDYEAIEVALLESARGRWFLHEFSQRNRSADTHMLLDAITKLEASVLRGDRNSGPDNLRHDLIEMADAIARTRQEIAAIKAPDDACQITTATEELDAIVESTEKATSDILEAAEDIQEVAWLLREKGGDGGTCDRLDERATDIYTACSFQDITGQRTGKVVNVLRFLENRVKKMIDIWGLDDIELRDIVEEDQRPDAHLLNGPQLHGKGLEQDDIDEMIDMAADGSNFASLPAESPVATEELASDPQTVEPEVPAGEVSSSSFASDAAMILPAQGETALDSTLDEIPAAETGTDLAMQPAPEQQQPAIIPEAEATAVDAPQTQDTAGQADLVTDQEDDSDASGTVAVEDFEKPEKLELSGLDAAKTSALFC